MSSSLKLFLGAVAFLLILSSFFIGCERIDAGAVGLKVNMTGGSQGVSKTEYVTGWQFYTRGLTKIYEFPTSQQPTEYKDGDKPEEFTVASKGGTPFVLHPSFSYSVNTGEVANMFQKLRLPLEQLKDGYIKNALRIALREVSNRFSPDSILNNVTTYDNSVSAELNEKLAPYFTVSQFTSNIIPSESLKNSLNAKALAIQEAAQLENEQKKIRVQAENDIIEAKRDSTVKVTNAQAEAKAISLQQQALQQSPQYVELIKAQKWDGKLPQQMFGGAIPMINLKN